MTLVCKLCFMFCPSPRWVALSDYIPISYREIEFVCDAEIRQGYVLSEHIIYSLNRHSLNVLDLVIRATNNINLNWMEQNWSLWAINFNLCSKILLCQYRKDLWLTENEIEDDFSDTETHTILEWNLFRCM